MGQVFDEVSFAAIWAVVAVEAVVLLELLRRAVRIKAEMYAAMPRVLTQEHLAKGTFVDFEAPDLATGAVVRSAELRGAASALLFMKAGAGRDVSEWLLDTVAGLLHKGEGRLYLLCDGTAAACSELSHAMGPELPVLLDEGGTISGRFLVRTTPAAVLLDGEARVAQYGLPEQSPDWEKEDT